jgi:hypothetical protein
MATIRAIATYPSASATVLHPRVSTADAQDDAIRQLRDFRVGLA